MPSADTVVEQKATERWKAIVAGDLRKAYEMISPAGRSTLTYETYRGSMKLGFHKGARVLEVRCPTAELCDVSLEVQYEFLRAMRTSRLSEKWVKQDHDWWYLYQR